LVRELKIGAKMSNLGDKTRLRCTPPVAVKAKPEHLWKPGQSGNPSGRPKGVASIREYILSRTKNGEELAEMMLEVARGAEEIRDKMTAIRWLSDYGFGKPSENVEHTGTITIEQLIAGANRLEASRLVAGQN